MKLKDIVTLETSSVNPQNKPESIWHLYSLPSFDEGKQCEQVLGKDIMSNKYLVPNKCILFNKLNVRFKRIWAVFSSDEYTICSTEFLPLVVNEDVADFDFVYHLLHSDQITNYLTGQNTNTSGSHKRIDPTDFLNIDVIMPSIEEQKRIGAILSNIERKIDLNSEINQNLEAMAKQLYDYWFVQFDFPNNEGKPYKSSGGTMEWNNQLKREIPVGWFAENICKVAKILSGGTPSKAVDDYWNGSIPFFGPTDCDGSIFQLDTAEHITESGLSHCASSKFDEGTVIITARGSVGKLVIVGTPMAMNQSCYALESMKNEYEYLYYLTKQLIEYLKVKGSGSVFKSIITQDIETSILCIAPEDIVTKYCDRVKAMFLQIKKNSEEIQTLIKQRDELLPLLLNGQVSVTQLNSDLSHD